MQEAVDARLRIVELKPEREHRAAVKKACNSPQEEASQVSCGARNSAELNRISSSLSRSSLIV
eukprot:4198470-Pleurochrysis_carterae.AAC.2